MAARENKYAENKRFLFARIGQMTFYTGPIPGDERLIGGGSYNEEHLGDEAFNFKAAGDGKLYGYFQPPKPNYTVALERIDTAARNANALAGVTIVFVAPRADGGQVIAGWYDDAEVRRVAKKAAPGSPRKRNTNCSASVSGCVLLPRSRRSFEIPRGKGGMGQSNVCYPLSPNGTPKKKSWMEAALRFVREYEGDNLLASPECEAEEEAAAVAEEALAKAQGQGFARTPEERRAIEDFAMKAAKAHFYRLGYIVEDVSQKRPYDLLCRKEKQELHVEVKGTTTKGNTVVLTYGETKHACDPKNSCVLFVLHSLEIDGKKITGGEKLIQSPWKIEQKQLKPISYIYQLS
jgi:Domain of unknown function (DUF3883)